MPKPPLFDETPLNQCIILLLRQMREHPKSAEDTAIINDLAALGKNPDGPMSERLVWFCIETGLVQTSRLQNFMVNMLECTRLTSIRAAIRLDINQWLLAHAASAGCMTVDFLQRKLSDYR